MMRLDPVNGTSGLDGINPDDEVTSCESVSLVRSQGSGSNQHRCEQDLNLRGETPLDFKSNALTTRPSQLDD
ncbi:hypothetical protein GOODEAATRI_008611, partial [Goodea atripinnis]